LWKGAIELKVKKGTGPFPDFPWEERVIHICPAITSSSTGICFSVISSELNNNPGTERVILQ
jgi:hypothetical protein